MPNSKTKKQSNKYAGGAKLSVVDSAGKILYEGELFDFGTFGMPLSLYMTTFDSGKFLIGAESLKKYRFGVLDISNKN